MTKYLLIIAALFVSIYMISCSDPVNTPVPDGLPETHLTLYPDSIIAPGSTTKRISWWGDSPQGFIVGYRISFDGINWGFTNKQDSTFFLSITGTDSTFKFFVAAVDDKGLIDPTPASNLYPVYNSPPTIAFNYTYTIPDTIYPVATLLWGASDPDGNNTIRNIYYAVNDTNNYRPIAGNLTQMTLTADSGLILNGNNRIYIKAQDNAGAYSNVSVMPDSGRSFYVKKNTARILLIADFPTIDQSNAYTYYNNALDTVKYNVLDIKSEGGRFTPKIINPMFVETLKLFKVVIWSGGSGTAGNVANFNLASSSLPIYKAAGGKVIFSSGFDNLNPVVNGLVNDFVPLDSITKCTVPFLIGPVFNPSSADYPVISSNSTVTGIKGIYYSGDIVPLYTFNSTAGCQGIVTFIIKDRQVNPRVIYSTLPIYNINGNAANNKLLFQKILFGEFGLN